MILGWQWPWVKLPPIYSLLKLGKPTPSWVEVDQGLVAEVKPTALSLMPDGLLDQLEPGQVRDLLSYLMSPVQVKSADYPLGAEAWSTLKRTACMLVSCRLPGQGPGWLSPRTEELNR